MNLYIFISENENASWPRLQILWKLKLEGHCSWHNITTQETTLIIRLCLAEQRIALLELDIIGDILAL